MNLSLILLLLYIILIVYLKKKNYTSFITSHINLGVAKYTKTKCIFSDEKIRH